MMLGTNDPSITSTCSSSTPCALKTSSTSRVSVTSTHIIDGANRSSLIAGSPRLHHDAQTGVALRSRESLVDLVEAEPVRDEVPGIDPAGTDELQRPAMVRRQRPVRARDQQLLVVDDVGVQLTATPRREAAEEVDLTAVAGHGQRVRLGRRRRVGGDHEVRAEAVRLLLHT